MISFAVMSHNPLDQLCWFLTVFHRPFTPSPRSSKVEKSDDAHNYDKLYNVAQHGTNNFQVLNFEI